MIHHYISLHNHTDSSLLDGCTQIHDLIKRLTELEMPAAAISDHGNILASVKFHKAANKAGIKPILGCELYLSKDCTIKTKENRKLWHQVVLAKSKIGWNNLIKLVSDSNHPDRFYHRPRLDYKYFEQNKPEGLITFSGHLGSDLANVVLEGDRLHSDWQKIGIKEAEYLRELFGKDNFYIEIQLMDAKNNPAASIVGGALREISKKTGIPCIATGDAHYAWQEQAEDQRVLIASALKTTFPKIAKALKGEPDDSANLNGFFCSSNFYIQSHQEMVAIHTQEEINNTIEIAAKCENYEITNKPSLPPFKCPDGQNEAEYLRQLCREGWTNKIKNRIPAEQHSSYADRVKHELEVLQGANLSGYFLIVQDILQHVRSKGWLVGPGRGSSCGCLVSYLIGITQIDPIPYNLLFERFYNAARAEAYPDIDVDIPDNKREQVIQYVKDKYGHDKVAQMATFQTMKGRGAIKEVLRVHGNITFDEMNRITTHIPDEAKIAGDLQEMKEETGESSIIRWALENRADKLREWAYLDDKGKIQGPLSKRFEQAIRLEGCKVNASKHASGIIVSSQNLDEVCPMIYDSKTKTQIAGLEMNDLADLGLVKLDLLGLSMLAKIEGIRQILATGDIVD